MNRGRVNAFIPIMAFLVLLGVFAIFSNGRIISAYNISNIVDQSIPIIIGGIGVIFVTATGSTDLSVGASAALASTLGALAAVRFGVWAMFVVAIAAGAIIGLINGVLVTKFKLSSFMTTLAMLISLRGLLSYFLTLELVVAPAQLIAINRFGVKLAMLLVLVAVAIYLFEYTKLGYFCKTIGENERTAIATGINVGRTRRIAFLLSGIMAAIFGIIQIVKIGGSTNSLCQFMEMRIQMAIFLGGVLVTGGFSARIYKLIIGSFTIVLIENGLMLCKVDTTLASAIQGILLIAVLFITIYFNNKRVKSTKSAA